MVGGARNLRAVVLEALGLEGVEAGPGRALEPGESLGGRRPEGDDHQLSPSAVEVPTIGAT